MDVIALAKSEADRKTGIDPDGSAGAYEEIAAIEVAGDGSGFFFGEIARTLAWTEGGRRGAGVGAVVIVVLLVRQSRSALQGCIHRWGRELDILGWC